MKGHILAGLFLCSLFFVVGGDAQSPNIPEKPVWTLEFIKVGLKISPWRWGTWTITGRTSERKLCAEVVFWTITSSQTRG